jgi:HK97 family phage portal protein
MLDRVLAPLARAAVQTRMTKPVAFTSRGNTAALFVSQRSKSWPNSAIAYRCVTAISSNASSLRLQIMRSDRTVVENHPLSQLWAAPNPLLSGRVFGEYLWQRLETKGETFVYLDRGESGVGPVVGMWPIFGNVTVHVDKNLAGEIVGYTVDVGGARVPLLASEVLWLRYPDGENEWGALAPLQAAAHAIGLDAHARAWQEGELKNGGRPSSVVYLGDLDEEQHAEAVASYRSRIEGASNAGRTLFVSSAQPAKVERMSLTPAELGWLDTRRTSWEEMTVAFGVPKDYLLGGATYENRNAARSTLWSDAIIPKLEVVAGEIARQLLAPGEAARFDTDDVEALQEGADAKATRTTSLVGVDVMVLDEARAEIGLEPLPNGLGLNTLSAYRMLLQLGAQQQLAQLGASSSASRIAFGPLTLGEKSTPLEIVAPRVTRAGLSFDDAQAEYLMHEKVGAKATKRLAGKQEQIVLRNLHKLFGRGGPWATKRAELVDLVESYADMRARAEAAPSLQGDASWLQSMGELETQLRAKIDDLLPAGAAESMTRSELEAFLSAVWSRGGATTAKALGISFDTFEIDVLLAMDARLDVLATQVTATTRRVLEDRVLLQGVANGESVDELAARVRATYSDLSTWRATTIARTETVGGFNHSSFLTAQSTNLVTARVWMSTGDTRTRDSHVRIDGERVIGFGTKYANGCRFPGDPAGLPEETILCRCVEQYETD